MLERIAGVLSDLPLSDMVGTRSPGPDHINYFL